MSGPTILVVEDDSAIRTLLPAALEDEGYRVLTSVDGPAVELACQQRPAVATLDPMMATMDGAEVSRQSRADPATAPIPITLMSGRYNLRGRSDHLPVNERLAKPVDLDRLSALIARWETVTAGEYL